MSEKSKIFMMMVVGTFLFFGCGKSNKPSLADFVNPLQGTDSSFELSTGNTYPAVALPWGMNFWTPQTGEMGSGWQYTYDAETICGFKQTHQPSPWINDYGCYSIMPIVGDLVTQEKDRASKFSHQYENAKPYIYEVKLESYDIDVALSPTNSGAIFNITFPETDQGYIIIDGYKDGSMVEIIPEERKIIGYSKYYTRHNKRNLPDNFAIHFVITFDKDFEDYGVWSNKGVSEGETKLETDRAGAYIKFSTKQGENITVKTASSFISQQLAQLHLKREIGKKDFSKITDEAKKIWDSELGKIEIEGGTEEQHKVFYTALYRTLLFPRALHEINENGEIVHWSAMNGKIEKGVMYTDNGFWDTFRCVHPFFTIMYPKLSENVMQALINYYHEGGWMPEWCSPGYNDCMIGQHSTSLIADAYAKGITNFDTESAWQAMIKGANNEGPVKAVGRDGCTFYNDLGYIPYDVGKVESVSKTLEYAYNDYCIAKFGEMIGKSDEEVELYRTRAMNYQNIFDPSINFVRPKDSHGNWQDNYRPDTWGGSFTEGSAWHWTWCVYHDIAGLIERMGGDEIFAEKLESVFHAEPTYECSAYGFVIHEIREMIEGGLGQYAHGNQPIQHGVYLFNYAGKPWKTQEWARIIMSTQYDSSESGLCGDEDNGQTSCWYVMSALGLYPVTPGEPEYVIGSPIFNKATMTLPNGNKFTVKATNNSDENVYIQSATLNGEVFNRTFIKHKEITSGGILEFEMGPKPNKEWGVEKDSRPFSMSKY